MRNEEHAVHLGFEAFFGAIARVKPTGQMLAERIGQPPLTVQDGHGHEASLGDLGRHARDDRGGDHMPNVWFTSDSHFGHDNIRRYCNRPFGSVTEMDEAMIASWNGVVRKGDLVWHLGDFAMARGVDERWLKRIFGKLNGQKSLVVGNHDGPAVRALAWHSQHVIAHVKVLGQLVICCHYPMRSWPSAFRGALHLFGHEHGRMPGTDRSLDVGVDSWNYAPVGLDAIKARMATLPPSPDAMRTGAPE